MSRSRSSIATRWPRERVPLLCRPFEEGCRFLAVGCVVGVEYVLLDAATLADLVAVGLCPGADVGQFVLAASESWLADGAGALATADAATACLGGVLDVHGQR